MLRGSCPQQIQQYKFKHCNITLHTWFRTSPQIEVHERVKVYLYSTVHKLQVQFTSTTVRQCLHRRGASLCKGKCISMFCGRHSIPYHAVLVVHQNPGQQPDLTKNSTHTDRKFGPGGGGWGGVGGGGLSRSTPCHADHGMHLRPCPQPHPSC